MALSMEGTSSLLSFLGGASLSLISVLGVVVLPIRNIVLEFYGFVAISHVVLSNVALYLKFHKNKETVFQPAVRGLFLGHVFSVGLLVTFSGTSAVHFGWYLVALSFFHWSEYFITAVTNPSSLSLESYLLDHSPEYKIAAVASWTEYWLEWFIFSDMKQFRYIRYVGLLLVVGGELLRKASMMTAKSNFNHYVQYRKQEGHQLVTEGVYSYFRHPSYVGWFYWSIGTQLVLCNPVCLLGYTAASWRFFQGRIYEEEFYLLNFFGDDYIDYQKRVGTGLPFIHGYKAEL